MNFPQTAAEWQQAIAAGLDMTPIQGQQAWASNTFPFERLAKWLAQTYNAEKGYSPEFVPALQRNLHGLVTWAYGNGAEPYWPGSDADSQT